ncbi:MAG: prepilin peptidase [Lachnospiraceae bacterium]|jgi:leader peptidase (prepilin peptidase)/N-methyltransferase|nr:prepilin peptidase [Lachnospiraceae bacterium]
MEFALYAYVLVLGLVIGSFLNVCIYRIPQKAEIVKERSHCLSCGHVLRWYELIPLASFLAQRGRCRSCQARLSWQYPAVELINGLAYLWIYQRFGLSVVAIFYALLASALLVIAVIDWRTYEIPLGLNIFIGGLGILHLLLNLTAWLTYVGGFFAASGVLFLIFALTKGRGIGGGDIKLMAVAGLVLGWQDILLALALGSIIGSVIHLSLMKLKGKERLLAFGPYLAAGIFLAMLYGDTFITWYIGGLT